MVKYGLISDTHVTADTDQYIIQKLLEKIEKNFRDVDYIIHAGDVSEELFLKNLENISPTKVVLGEMDKIKDLPKFIKFISGKYTIGVIHKQPENIEQFVKKNKLHILIFGHTHQPAIQGTPYNTLLINPGSPTKPVAPPPKRGFAEPIARASVITLKIDENDILSTFLINL